jgi:hypothetical protein
MWNRYGGVPASRRNTEFSTHCEATQIAAEAHQNNMVSIATTTKMYFIRPSCDFYLALCGTTSSMCGYVFSVA